MMAILRDLMKTDVAEGIASDPAHDPVQETNVSEELSNLRKKARTLKHETLVIRKGCARL